MISIIVCSTDDIFFSNFSSSVKETIGVPYELIKIENSKERLSIAKAYNLGAIKSNYNILVFVHEDVVFHTKDWGKKLIEYFGCLENPGIIGIAGNSYHPSIPSDWWVPSASHRHFNFISNKKEGKPGDGVLMSSQDNQPTKIFCLDGVFMAIGSDVFSTTMFDESLEGFHGYDTSISLRVSKVNSNYFVPDILIEHFSSGNYTYEFWKSTVLANFSYFNSFKRTDPFNFKIEYYSLKKFVINSFRYKLNIMLFFDSIRMFFYQLVKV